MIVFHSVFFVLLAVVLFPFGFLLPLVSFFPLLSF